MSERTSGADSAQATERAVEPCPMGCGGMTEDPYGGPCEPCWNDMYDDRGGRP